ncbi:magnesium transporter CorA family protein [Phenylobacterium sp.]|jgi:magnesium transporter|uniref:magnesium transporter CorA family protein n=1 Tax=Phenylobacterium sp. TaxID=1871053 RepID=UPI002F3F11F6
MLNIYPKPSDGGAAASAPVWLDLFPTTDDEIAAVETQIGASLPRRGALSEIEMSSRLRQRKGVLTMSTPMALRPSPDASTAPLGFVLSAERLVTIRFADSPAFEAVMARLNAAEAIKGGGPEVFTELCEEIVDRIADGLEHLAEELTAVSTAAFRVDDRENHALKSNRALRAKLRQVGRLGDRLSEVRDSLLGLTRIVAFTEQFGCSASEPDIKARLASLRHDLTSLSDYDEHLANKVQFVLDALVGLIGIAQNDIFKVLTIVSIVGIPPTLMAGVYGMNFKNMPEYDWSFGYQYGLAVIVLSAVLPLIWFKVKGWF